MKWNSKKNNKYNEKYNNITNDIIIYIEFIKYNTPTKIDYINKFVIGTINFLIKQNVLGRVPFTEGIIINLLISEFLWSFNKRNKKYYWR